jgi:hypothetical protein
LSRTSMRILIAVLVVLIGGFVLAKLRYAGQPTVNLPATECNTALWDHVYERDRLHVIEPCAAVEGRVVSLHRSSDGDLHISLDPDDKSALNLVNLTHARGTLVIEAVCDHAPAKDEAVAACAGFVSQVKPPIAGERVRMIGAYVTDRDNGWTEVHPVTRIERLR